MMPPQQGQRTKLAADYEDRSREYGFADVEETRRALADPRTYVLDVRTPDEIASSRRVPHGRWVQTTCTAAACPDLAANPDAYVPDRAATVVVYCKSGRRAARAAIVLRSKGHTGPILNAGGYDDMEALDLVP